MLLESIKTNLDKLTIGCLLRSYRKENGEPENIAIGQVSSELKFLQRQREYASEIERVMKELRLTVLLIKDCQTREPVAGFSRQAFVAYYQGVFFSLVHQIKDKIVKLVNLMTEEVIPEKPAIEKAISAEKLLKNKTQKLQLIGIEDEIKQWEQDNESSKIAVVLRKRTQHHHYISRLRYDKDFLNLNFTDVAIQPNIKDQFTIYGIEQIEKMRLESTERLFSGAVAKAVDTLSEIEENIESISSALVNYYKLPITQEEAVTIARDHMKMHEAFDILNKCSFDKVIEPFKSMLEAIISDVKESFQEQTTAIYLVGSLGRGEFEEGYSDIDIYSIHNFEGNQGQGIFENGLLSVRFFSRDEFLSDSSKKYRIIAKADGILLYGEDLVRNEKPKAGLLLALTLNEDITETLNEAIKWIEENSKATPQSISEKSKQLAKCFIDFIYGAAMANKPHYTSSRVERVDRINEIFPNNKTKTEMLVNVSRYGIENLETLQSMIEDIRPMIENNLKIMRAKRDSIEKQKSGLA